MPDSASVSRDKGGHFNGHHFSYGFDQDKSVHLSTLFNKLSIGICFEDCV